MGMGPAPAHGRIRLATPQQTDLPESACRGGGVLWRHVGGARLPHAHPALILHPFYGGITLTTTPDDSWGDRKSTRLNSSHVKMSYAVFRLKNKTKYKL